MKSLHDVLAPAKLNLFLHIVGRRADGYHLLQSAFMLIDWADTLHFEQVNDSREITREDLGVALPANDLVMRAAKALQEAAHINRGARIAISKQIPSEAGMGGGSSDAASTLLALNRLWNANVPMDELCRIGLTLGADVPFFLYGKNAWVEGIGEKITPVALPPADFVVIKPKEGVATPEIFASPLLKRDSVPAIISGFAANPYCFGSNDLQPVAQALCPSIETAIEWLQSQGLQGRMTGSGSAVFAKIQQQPLSDIRPDDWQMRRCSNLDVHPLFGWAPSDD